LLLRRLDGPTGDAQIRSGVMDFSMSSQPTPAPAPPAQPPLPPPPTKGEATGAVEGRATWRLPDRIGLAICCALGLLFCLIAVAITVYLLVQGIKFLKPSMLVTPASTG